MTTEEELAGLIGSLFVKALGPLIDATRAHLVATPEKGKAVYDGMRAGTLQTMVIVEVLDHALQISCLAAPADRKDFEHLLRVRIDATPDSAGLH